MSTHTPDPSGTRTAGQGVAVPRPLPNSASAPAVTPVAATRPPVAGADHRRTPFWRAYSALAELIDRRVGWDRLPLVPGLAVLLGLRNILRWQNLQDPSTRAPIVNAPQVPPRTPQHLVARSADGSHNDLDHPDMGMARARFGRNIPLEKVLAVTEEELLRPSPREVSRRLLTRTAFQPAETVNTLAAAWLQFMVRDWFSHGQGDTSRLVEIPLERGDTWWESPMRIPRTHSDPTRPPDADGPVTTINELTH